jgi:hypothetical protein
VVGSQAAVAIRLAALETEQAQAISMVGALAMEPVDHIVGAHLPVAEMGSPGAKGPATDSAVRTTAERSPAEGMHFRAQEAMEPVEMALGMDLAARVMAERSPVEGMHSPAQEVKASAALAAAADFPAMAAIRSQAQGAIRRAPGTPLVARIMAGASPAVETRSLVREAMA